MEEGKKGSGRQVTAYEPWMRVGKTLEKVAKNRKEDREEGGNPASGGDGPPGCF